MSMMKYKHLIYLSDKLNPPKEVVEFNCLNSVKFQDLHSNDICALLGFQ